ILQLCTARTGPDDGCADPRDETAARDFFFEENRHDHSSITSDCAAFEFLPAGASSIPDTPAAIWDRPEWSRFRSTCTCLRQISSLSTRRVSGSHRLGLELPSQAVAE